MKIKVCGLTTEEEASYANENQVDFVGMVLYFPKSRRNISVEQAKKIMRKLDPSIKKTAVVVEPSLEQVRTIEEAGFDFIQIHGRMPDGLAEQTTIPVWKAFNVSDMDKYEEYHRNPRIAGYVFDALEPGSGRTFDWELVKQVPRDEKLFLLAGGLNAENVEAAIRFVRPDGVDVSSGVENCGGNGKDREKIAEFVEKVRRVEGTDVR